MQLFFMVRQAGDIPFQGMPSCLPKCTAVRLYLYNFQFNMCASLFRSVFLVFAKNHLTNKARPLRCGPLTTAG
ncbi:hypothetical protein [Candidatus Soleaferrea massiliensis]|uniref:hypothetical protein n=1 Tax=Candidatus Soleaferrea massiliensis TaxID=1470354 RepID=UPI00058B9F4E|nr:hypothetical protein [Candidatus Soleaferrea massiliensis]